MATPANLRDSLIERGLGPKSVGLYLRTIQAAEGWCEAQGTDLARVGPSLIAEYLTTVPASWSSRKGLRSALKHYWEIIERDRPPLGAVKVPPKPAMECRALDEEDARRLAKTARARRDLKGFAVALGLYEALRREEIATLRWDAFDEDEWLTIHGKGGRRRTIPIHPVIVDLLTDLPRADEYVFPGRFGGPSNPATIWAWVREVAEVAGVGLVRPHWLRHTCLATQNDNTGDLRSVQHFAGHSRPETTAGYTRATRSRLMAVTLSVDY
jgi:integrase/recombinase XerD